MAAESGGELLLAVKIENKRGLANSGAILAVPGIGMAEWGPTDMGMSLAEPYYHSGYEPDPAFANPPFGPVMLESLQQVRTACKANGVALYCTMRPNDWREASRDGRAQFQRHPADGDVHRRSAPGGGAHDALARRSRSTGALCPCPETIECFGCCRLRGETAGVAARL